MLQIPVSIKLPLLGEVRTVVALIGGVVLVAALLFLLGLFIGRGTLAESNAQQVRKIRALLEDLGHEIATPQEARAMLGLKGKERVAF